MAVLSVTNDFTTGTQIVASEMNQNFTDIETFVNTTPGLVQNGLVDAKGDLLVGTANDTIARQAVGTDGEALVADSTATAGVAWATPTDTTKMPLAGGTFTGAITGTDATFTGETTTYMSFNSQTGTAYTLVLADASQTIEMNNESANTLTVPPNSSVAFPVGTQILVVQQGAGATTVVAGSGVTLRSVDGNLGIDGQYASVALMKRATDEWYVVGALV